MFVHQERVPWVSNTEFLLRTGGKKLELPTVPINITAHVVRESRRSTDRKISRRRRMDIRFEFEIECVPEPIVVLVKNARRGKIIRTLNLPDVGEFQFSISYVHRLLALTAVIGVHAHIVCTTSKSCSLFC